MPSCFAIIPASLICFARQQRAGFLMLWCKPSNSHFGWQNTFQFRAMKNIHVFYVLFDFHSSWCSLRKQWMLCFQEMAALEYKAIFVSGKNSYGAVMMHQPAKALCAQAKGLGFSITKWKPRLLQPVLIFDTNKASFSCLQFSVFVIKLGSVRIWFGVFFAKKPFFLQFSLTLPFVTLHCRKKHFLSKNPSHFFLFYFAESSSWLFFSCDSYLNFFSCVSLSKKDKDFDG